MKKFVITLVLLLVIAVSGFFSFLYVSFNIRDPENSVNKNLRKPVLSYPALRKLLRLTQVGDARYEYMDQNTLPLRVYLYYQDGVSLTEDSLRKMPMELNIAAHKLQSVVVDGPTVLSGIPTHVEDTDLDGLLNRFEKPDSLFSNQVSLNIFVLHYYTPHSSYGGLVIDANSIFLFKDALQNVSETEASLPAIEISTILHEFAHLGGAQHIKNQDCILADKVETLDFFNKIATIRQQYCDDDIKEINRALEF